MNFKILLVVVLAYLLLFSFQRTVPADDQPLENVRESLAITVSQDDSDSFRNGVFMGMGQAVGLGILAAILALFIKPFVQHVARTFHFEANGLSKPDE